MITVICGVLFILSGYAMADDDYSAVEAKIRALAPQTKSIAISETPVDGLLMVQIGGEIVYATADGKYLIQGRMMDLDTREDLTEAAKAGVRREILASVDPTQQITFAPEDPKYDLMVFTDIDCGYCRKLHSQISEYNDQGIAIHYMSFPRAGIGSPSYDKAVSVWCADDPQTALTHAKLGEDPTPAQCDNPVAEQYQLGRELGVTGTPSLVTTQGMMIPGYVPPEQLRQRLDQLNGVSAAD
jgi:thiol:disulfide interchange protein DsbC